VNPWIDGATIGRVIAAAIVVYATGYVTGALLVSPSDDRRSLALAIVRLTAGLLLTTIAFLASLVVSLPWLTGPVLVLVVALAVHRGKGLALPTPTGRWDRSKVAAVILCAVLVAPVVIFLRSSSTSTRRTSSRRFIRW
jgi:hypothetical protein